MLKYIFVLFVLFTSLVFAELPTLKAEQKHLKISQMKVDIMIVGDIATTTFDITYYNPFARDLTGEFSMPLKEGQTISRYALMIGDTLREGVVVEKLKARQTFEAVVRKKIDPGIVNITKGNYFRTKIYPIPAKGKKRVVIALTERLTSDSYLLPIEDQETIDKFILDIQIKKGATTQANILSEFDTLNITQDNQAYLLHFQKSNFAIKRPIKFKIPKLDSSDHQLYTQTIDDKTYFYLQVKPPILTKSEKKSPKDITIYWDNSFSASKRDKTKELALLDTYLKSIKNSKDISVVVFNYRIQETKKFHIDQKTSTLINYLKNLKNDGGTMLSRLKFNQKSDEILLFSDAINTIGADELELGKAAVYSITSSIGSNYSFLKRVAAKTNGAFINLDNLSQQEALDILSTNREKYLFSKFDKSQISQLYPSTATQVGQKFAITGMLQGDKANLTINYGNQSGITKQQTFLIEKKSDSPIVRVWASHKIEALSLDETKNKKEIEKLSKKYNILTKNSAFIVLDRVEDYVQHEIEPPKELQSAYFELLAEVKKEKKESSKNIHARNIERIEALKEWYKNPPKVEVYESDGEGGDIAPMVEPSVEPSAVLAAAPSPEVSRESRSTAKTKRNGNSHQAKASIKILSWMPDAPYMKKLREVSLKEFNKYYFQFKKENLNRPAFYIEVSDYLFKKGQHKKAVRVLTNTLELELENPELLKVVAKRLLDEKEYTMAILIYKEIKELRPEEPQSYRDLAIAYAHKKLYQKALDTYTYILSKEWGRFDDIKDTIFNEYNALIKKHKKRLKLKKVPKEYIYSMPLDVRITVSWSSNENDIDLWVVDPNGEKCYYSHPNTKIGGKISRDFTRGYGPEEYSVKKAKRGLYTVYLHYYSESRQSITGPVTIHATLTTHYGTKREKSKNIMIQLEKDKDTMQIGMMEFEK